MTAVSADRTSVFITLCQEGPHSGLDKLPAHGAVMQAWCTVDTSHQVSTWQKNYPHFLIHTDFAQTSLLEATNFFLQ
jgi:hypothetical protein